MPWGVVKDGKVYDVVCRGRGQPFPQYRVFLERKGVFIYLGDTLKDTSGITPNWWTFGHTLDWPGKARGFATRRFAIEHMLRKEGWWPDD